MITDRISQDGAVHVRCDARSLVVGVATRGSGTLRVYKDQDTRVEPYNVVTIGGLASVDLSPTGEALLVCGGQECWLHDVGLVVSGKGEAVDLPPPETIIKSAFRVTDATFTHGGDRALVGDLGARLSLLDLGQAGKEITSTNVEGEIVGLSYNSVLDLVAVVAADGTCFVYRVSVQNGSLEKVANLGALFVDKRVMLTEELMPEDSDFSDDDDDDEDSLISATTDSYNTARGAKQNKKLLRFAASRCAWSPNGDYLAVPGKDHKVYVYKTGEWNKAVKVMTGGAGGPKAHFSDIAFSKDGMKVATLSVDKKLILWDVEKGATVGHEGLGYVGNSIVWTTNSSLAIGSTAGELSSVDSRALSTILAANSDLAEELGEDTGEPAGAGEDLFGDEDAIGDDVNMDEDDAEEDIPQSQDEDGFVVDDAGSDKRSRVSESTELTDTRKRVRIEDPRAAVPAVALRPFSQGATPWHGNRRYLTISQTGVAYTVKGEGAAKVTVNFFDTSDKRDYHFDDMNGFDLCAMDSQGCVFATSGYGKRRGYEAVVTYKAHSQIGSETLWSRQLGLGGGEFITSVSAGETSCFVCTSRGVVRRYTNHGRLVDMWVSDPIVGVISNDKFVFTVVAKGGAYWYNVQKLGGEYVQQNRSAPLEERPKAMFFSKDGNPVVVREEDDTMVVLAHWRRGDAPLWRPILNMQEAVERKAKGNELKAWPLALNDDEVMFVPYRGTRYPIFPLLSPMMVDVEIPCGYKPKREQREKVGQGSASEEEPHSESESDDDDAEEQYLRYKTLAELVEDGANNGDVRDENFEEKLREYKVNTQKALLLLFSNAVEEDANDDAFSLCLLMEVSSLVFAQRIAERQSMVQLVNQIVRLREAHQVL